MRANKPDPPARSIDRSEAGMPGTPRIIVVDDEPELRQILQEYLGRHGFAVRAAASGHQLDTQLAAEPADLLILDLSMPEEDGLSVARRLRARSSVPILILTAANEVVDRVVGLEVGADDYVTKPFDLRELLARVRALLRRSQQAAVTSALATLVPDSGNRVRFGKALLEIDTRSLLDADGERLPLTAMEFDLLHAFAQNPNRVLTRDRLLDLAHNRDNEPFDRSIDIRIARLRRKIEPDPTKPQVIKTVHGSGYMFVQRT